MDPTEAMALHWLVPVRSARRGIARPIGVVHKPRVPMFSRRRWQIAMFNASRARSVRSEDATFQPKIYESTRR